MRFDFNVADYFSLLVVFKSFITMSSGGKDSKIYGGVNCDIKNHAYYAYIDYAIGSTAFMCGGSILAIDKILTAGHCCYGMTNGTVYTGFYRNKKSYDQVVGVKLPPIIHAKFDPVEIGHDVCILKTYIEYSTHGTRGTFTCGGSILSTTAVLTAGHCCYGLSNATIFSGFNKPGGDFDQAVAVKYPTLHPRFDPEALSSDVCVMKLNTPLRITKRTKLVNLASKKQMKDIMDNKDENKSFELHLMGYGVNKRDKSGEFVVDERKPFQCTTTLLKTQNRCLQGIHDAEDRKRFNRDTMFCHYNPTTKTRGSCEGDSGSPILYKEKQIGLISWGPNEEICTERVEVGARLDNLLEWITSKEL